MFNINIPLGGGNSANKSQRAAYTYGIQYGPEYNRSQITSQVAAYREAGLHPAFAMGGGFSGSSPGIVGGTEDTGGMTVSRKVIRPQEAALIRESNSRRNLIDEQTRAQRIENNQRLGTSIDPGRPLSQGKPVTQAEIDAAVQLQPAMVKPASNQELNRVAGPNRPGMVEMQVTPERSWLVPDQDLIEGGELIGAAAAIVANYDRAKRLRAAKERRRKSMATRHPPRYKDRSFDREFIRRKYLNISKYRYR